VILDMEFKLIMMLELIGRVLSTLSTETTARLWQDLGVWWHCTTSSGHPWY